MQGARFAVVYVDAQLPLPLADSSEPEPDVLAAVGTVDDYPNHPHAEQVRLLVEVSDSTLAYDRQTKASLYATAGIADYWILNLVNRQIEVFRDPALRPGAPFGAAYKSLTIFLETDTLMPLFTPDAVLTVSELLPPETTC